MLLRKIVRTRVLLLLLSVLPWSGCGVVYQSRTLPGWDGSFKLQDRSANLGAGQGYASSGAAEGNYFFDTQALYLSSAYDQMKLVDANRDLLLAGTNHMGDGDYFDGKVYGVIEHWAGCQVRSSPIYISIFDGRTLKSEDHIEISADLPEASGIAIIPPTKEAVVTSFCDPNNLYVYSILDWKLQRKIPLSMPIHGIQGAAYREGILYISQTSGALYGLRVENDEMRFLFQASMRGEFEGIDFHTEQLRWLVNQTNGQHILYSFAWQQN